MLKSMKKHDLEPVMIEEFVKYGEELGRERWMEEGRKQGIEQGIEQGIGRGIDKGRTELLIEAFSARLERALDAPAREAIERIATRGNHSQLLQRIFTSSAAQIDAWLDENRDTRSTM